MEDDLCSGCVGGGGPGIHPRFTHDQTLVAIHYHWSYECNSKPSLRSSDNILGVENVCSEIEPDYLEIHNNALVHHSNKVKKTFCVCLW